MAIANEAEVAVILTAGRGGRLGIGVPKCLLRLGERTLLEWQALALAAVGVRRIVVVVGYRKDLVAEECTRLTGKLGLRFELVDNEAFHRTNTSVSLLLALPAVRGESFFLLNGDVLVDPELIRRLQESEAPTCLLVEEGPVGEEEVKVVAGGDLVVRIGKELDPAEALGEFSGVARFSAFVAERLFEALDQLVVVEGLRNEFFEAALDRMASETELRLVGAGGLAVVEIDFPEDLERARLEVLPRILGNVGTHGSRPDRVVV